MTKTTYHEFYGEIPVGLMRAIKKHNVSPADFQRMEYKEMSFSEMLDFIKDNSPNGQFSPYSLFGY